MSSELLPANETDHVGHGRASVDPAGRILATARTLFLTEGLDGVTVSRLAREASTSKSTIYKYYGDMAGVLRAVAEREADHISFDPAEPAESRAAFARQLSAMGAELIELIERPEKVRFDQLVQEQARAHPDLAADTLSEHLLMMLQGLARVRLRLGLPVDDQDAKTRSRDAVRTLLGLG